MDRIFGVLIVLALVVFRFSVSGLEASSLDCRNTTGAPERLDVVTLYVMSADSLISQPSAGLWRFERKAIPAAYTLLIYNHPIFRFRYAWAAARDSAGNELPRECSRVVMFPAP